MIERVSERIALAIKAANPEETNSVAVMKWELSLIIHLVSIFIACSVVGLLTGKIEDTIIAFLAFVGIRFLSGGKHMKSLEGCLVVSVILISIIPHIPISSRYILPINIFNAVSMALFAPLIREQTNISNRAIPYFKLVTILLVSSNFLVNSLVLSLAFMSQALLIILWRR
ncbi:MAG TPA: accessory gene regulator B family protein [Bacilli bacterium]